MPTYRVAWSYTEEFEATDEQAALSIAKERLDRFTQPSEFGVKRRFHFWVDEIDTPAQD